MYMTRLGRERGREGKGERGREREGEREREIYVYIASRYPPLRQGAQRHGPRLRHGHRRVPALKEHEHANIIQIPKLNEIN